MICGYLYSNSPLRMLEATLHLLCTALRMNYGRPDMHCLNLYKSIVILIFSATLQSSADIQQTSINDAVAKMQSYFSEWISGMYSGRDMFGGDRYATSKTAVAAELKVLYGTFLYGFNLNDIVMCA